jgi:hypothetical protein
MKVYTEVKVWDDEVIVTSNIHTLSNTDINHSNVRSRMTISSLILGPLNRL